MHLDCPHCRQALEYSGKRPSFCAYCGKAIDAHEVGSTATIDPNAATQPPEPAAGDNTPPPEILGGYRLLRPLGSGGMGSVYEAEEITTGRHVALKMIAAEYAASTESVERFRREGRLASAVVDPRCVFVLAADEEAGRPYIVMELMPGTTLKDLVDRQGPLPPAAAVAKILDVIDGLRAAHRLGVVHRDVKPSNCFLDTDGRIKIGDFGLSKSLARGVHLTQTGAFLGTPQFASPEQVRGETVDQQSDLYSTAATLYYLLTGQAPFESDNAAVTLARIVSDPPPPMRTLRPELSPALDDVVLRALERDRQRRWRDLEEFRAALLPFMPGWQEAAGLGVRFGAFLIDYLILSAASFVIVLTMFAMYGWMSKASPWQMLLGVGLWTMLFLVPESIWGCSLGKWVLGLRVRKAGRRQRAGVGRIVLRTLVFYLLVNLGGLAAMPLLWGFDTLPNEAQMVRSVMFVLLFYPLTAAGIGLVLCTMRTRNGYRGVHEFASGTRVVRLPGKERKRIVRAARPEQALEHPDGLPERLGSYAVRGALCWEEGNKVLVGEDKSLERRVALWLRPATEPPLQDTRRALTRPTRLRWLASGSFDGHQWDAFMSASGISLPELVAGEGPQPWSEVRPLLLQLTEELLAADKDGTLPPLLGVEQVLIQNNGQVELLDWCAGRAGPRIQPDQADSQRGLALLAEVAVLALEGRPRDLKTVPDRKPGIRALLPQHAVELLGRLLSVGKPYRSVQKFHAALLDVADRPAEVTPGRRAACLAVSTALVGLAVLSCMMPAGWAPGFMVTIGQTVELDARHRALQDLDQGAGREAAVAAVNPNPLVRLRGIAQFEADMRLRAQLKKRIDEEDAIVQARLGSNWLLKAYSELLEKEMQKQAQQGKSLGVQYGAAARVTSFRFIASTHASGQPDIGREVLQFFGIAYAIQLLFWPIVWVIWAFLWRGGLSYRWLGLALARWDGRKAARWRCAWRTLLVWTPVVALWGTSLWLDVWSWSTLGAAAGNSWWQWLSAGLWWAGLALLPLYALLAILYPRRSLHDWLAGTYVVPR
jgi:hypothetical protein